MSKKEGFSIKVLAELNSSPKPPTSLSKIFKPAGIALAGFVIICSLNACGNQNEAPSEPQRALATVSSNAIDCIPPSSEIIGPSGSLIPNPDQQGKYFECLNPQNPTPPYIPSPPSFPTPSETKKIESNTPSPSIGTSEKPTTKLLFQDGIPDESNYLASGKFRVDGMKDILGAFSAKKNSFIIPSDLLTGSGFELMAFHNQGSQHYYFALVPVGKSFDNKVAYFDLDIDDDARIINDYAHNTQSPKVATNTFKFFFPFTEGFCQAYANKYKKVYERIEIPIKLTEFFGDKISPTLQFFKNQGANFGYVLSNDMDGEIFIKKFIPGGLP